MLSARELFKDTRTPAPWPRMVLCAIGTGVPLALGASRGDYRTCIYGALLGYLLALNDHLGALSKRFGVLFLTFVFLVGGFVLGFLLQSEPELLYPALAALVYWIGLLGGEGAEFERALLFLTLSIVIAFFAKSAPLEAMMPVLGYSVIAFASLAIAIPLLVRVRKYEGEPAASVRGSFKKSLARSKHNHIHAASYTAAALIALWMIRHFSIERGYWIVVTVLLVMRADRTLSLYVTAQRLLGTAAGVLIFDLLVQAVPLSHSFFLVVAILCSVVIPMALKRNYLVASFLVTAYVLALLEMSLTQPGDTTTAFLRLRATAVGCLLSVVGTLIAKVLSRILVDEK